MNNINLFYIYKKIGVRPKVCCTLIYNLNVPPVHVKNEYTRPPTVLLPLNMIQARGLFSSVGMGQ